MKTLVNTSKCVGLKDIYEFYDKKVRVWHEKYVEIQKEYEQYEKLVVSNSQIITKITDIMTKIYMNQDKYKGGEVCYKKYLEGFKAKFESIKNEEEALTKSRNDEEISRFQVE